MLLVFNGPALLLQYNFSVLILPSPHLWCILLEFLQTMFIFMVFKINFVWNLPPASAVMPGGSVHHSALIRERRML